MPAIFDIDLFFLLDVMSSEMLPSIRYQVGTTAVENLAKPMKPGCPSSGRICQKRGIFVSMLVKPTIISDGHEGKVTTDALRPRPDSISVSPLRPHLPASYLRGYLCTVRRLSTRSLWSRVIGSFFGFGGTDEDLDAGALPLAGHRARRPSDRAHRDQFASGRYSNQRTSPGAASDRFSPGR